MFIPTPNGGTHLFQPRWQVTPEVREAIHRAARLTLTQRDRTPEQIVWDGRAALERTRKAAILNGQAIAQTAKRHRARDDFGRWPSLLSEMRTSWEAI